MNAPTALASTNISVVTALEIAPVATMKLDVVSIKWQFPIKILSSNFYVMDTKQTHLKAPFSNPPVLSHHFSQRFSLTNSLSFVDIWTNLLFVDNWKSLKLPPKKTTKQQQIPENLFEK